MVIADETILSWTDAKGNVMKTTVHDYDKKELICAVRKQTFGIGVALIMHFHLGLKGAMVTQSILPLKIALQNKLVRINVLHEPVLGGLARPFN